MDKALACGIAQLGLALASVMIQCIMKWASLGGLYEPQEIGLSQCSPNVPLIL
jgi:hypothetical protein